MEIDNIIMYKLINNSSNGMYTTQKCSNYSLYNVTWNHSKNIPDLCDQIEYVFKKTNLNYNMIGNNRVMWLFDSGFDAFRFHISKDTLSDKDIVNRFPSYNTISYKIYPINYNGLFLYMDLCKGMYLFLIL